ncbi:hypothetical protein [Roseimicrobium sp. ORNL1]|uniref:hypothetical protein n=1 Tax=Roseimicrobium sp. ORNL1 TaxID=2711231 RepID=UPI0013E0F764|nr:hypothetical protein [Roseimicrobium sp. ORNL1]QIF02006.1 hypothetical protein G5S37_10835 [Roseimicrobium sp. ORNL1]
MPDSYHTIGTDQWQILLPGDWAYKPPEGDRDRPAPFYFESADGTKAAYLSVFDRTDPDIPALTALATWRDHEITNLHAMADHQWEILEEWAHEEDGTAISGSDCLARAHGYRILCLRMTRHSWLVRASLHDYECTDYATSQQYFQPIVDSFAPVIA